MLLLEFIQKPGDVLPLFTGESLLTKGKFASNMLRFSPFVAFDMQVHLIYDNYHTKQRAEIKTFSRLWRDKISITNQAAKICAFLFPGNLNVSGLWRFHFVEVHCVFPAPKSEQVVWWLWLLQNTTRVLIAQKFTCHTSYFIFALSPISNVPPSNR